MGRLKSMPPRLATMAPRIGSVPVDERARSRQRDADQSWRAWYKTARWQKLRRQVLLRDLFTCKQTGVILVGKHPAPDSPVVDHIKPHRGDERLFWDAANLQTVSKAFHDSEKQKQERAPGGHW